MVDAVSKRAGTLSTQIIRKRSESEWELKHDSRHASAHHADRRERIIGHCSLQAGWHLIERQGGRAFMHSWPRRMLEQATALAAFGAAQTRA